MLTMSWVTSNSSSSARNTARKEFELRASSMLRLKKGLGGFISFNSGKDEGLASVVELLADVL